MMDSPSQILDSLIDAQEVVSALFRTKPIVCDLQSSQRTHSSFGQRIALDTLFLQEGRHPVEMGFQEGDDFLKRFRFLSIHRLMFQLFQGCSGFLFVLAVFEDMPDASQEGTPALRGGAQGRPRVGESGPAGG